MPIYALPIYASPIYALPIYASLIYVLPIYAVLFSIYADLSPCLTGKLFVHILAYGRK